MRLICGFVNFDGAPADPRRLNAMLDALTWPGQTPNIRERIEGSAALGVLDFSGGSRTQGLRRGPNGKWLAADLRLDRSPEMAETLALPTDSDAETIALVALGRWGRDLPDRLDGDYALAAWDPSQQTLTCMRDIMGVRPLCYIHRPGRFFAFASLPRGLHAAGVVAPRLDMAALGEMLLANGLQDDKTGFLDIFWLRAGHSLVVSRDAMQIHQAWRPDPALVGSWRGSAADAAARLRQLVTDAVTARLPDKAPVAAHLSGGMDSSAVAIISARALRGRKQVLHAFSELAEPSPGNSLLGERLFVDAVRAQEPDMHWSPVYLPPLDTDHVLDPDLPLGGIEGAPDAVICDAAARAGVELVLAGIGGDQIASYGGSDLYAEILRSGHWRVLITELRTRSKRENRSLARTILARLVVPMLPDWMLNASAVSRRPFNAAAHRKNAFSFLSASLAGKVVAGLTAAPDHASLAHSRIALLTQGGIDPRGARWATIGARHGVAFTYPLADRRIIDFCLSLPAVRLLDGGFSRQPFRNAMSGILPDAIRLRETKVPTFPDYPSKLAVAADGLLLRLDRIRQCRAAQEAFDMDAIAAALRAAAAHKGCEGMTLGGHGQQNLPSWFRMAHHAMKALTLAEYVARHQ